MAKRSSRIHPEPLWAEFELLIASIFRHSFNCSDIKFEITDLRGDGGKDGVAEIVMFKSDPILNEAQFNIWLEVKFRTGGGNLNEYDIGGNVVIALVNNVHSLYVVTNKSFSDRAKQTIKTLGQRLNCHVHFIGKKELLEFIGQHAPSGVDTIRLQELLALTPEEAGRMATASAASAVARKGEKYRIRIRFSGSVDSPLTKAPAPEMLLHQGELYFMTVDVVSNDHVTFSMPPLRVASCAPEKLEIYPYNTQFQSPLCPEGYQSVYMFLPRISGKVVLGEHYNVDLDLPPESCIEWECDQSVRVKSRLNCEWQPQSLAEATEPLFAALSHWLDGDGVTFASGNIIAAAGCGKSFLVRKLRHDALHRSAHRKVVRQPNILSVFIDCKAIKSPKDIISVLFIHLLAGDPASSLFLSKANWGRVLENILGIPSNILERFIDWMQNYHGLEGGAQISKRDMVTISALLLKNVSRKRKILLVVEDLHKTDPDTFQFLLDLRAHLERGNDSTLFLVFTSRWEKSQSATVSFGSIGHEAEKTDESIGRWMETFDSLLSGIDERLNIYLRPFARGETIQLLCDTVIGLSAEAADSIVAQVGTDPFSLREALLFWEMSCENGPDAIAKCGGALERLPDGTGYRLEYPENLALERISTPNLSRATRERLMIARSYSPHVADLLEYGACVGSSFSYEAIEKILVTQKNTNQYLLDDGYEYCQRFDLLREYNCQPGECEFAHDLLRLETIRSLPSTRHRRIARALLDNRVHRSHLEQAELCYQAGRREEQFHLTRQILAQDKTTARNRLVAALLQVLALDTEVKWDFLTSLPFLDWNVAVRPPEARAVSSSIKSTSGSDLLLSSYQFAIQSMRTITGASNELWERLATAGAMLAARRGDQESICLFNYYSGRYHYDHMEFEKALDLLNDVEAGYQKIAPDNEAHHYGYIDRLFAPTMTDAEMTDWVSREGAWAPGGEDEDHRQENLFYISFSQRHLDDTDGFFLAMRRALELRKPRQWRIIGQALANLGAFHLHRDLAETWRYWHRGLKIMRCCGYQPYLTEFTVNLGHLAMLLGRIDEADDRLQQGLLLAKRNEQKGQEIRAHFHRGCLEMLRGNWRQANKYLDTTMEAALTHKYHRRLWRIRANFASLHEVTGNYDEAAHYDRLCARKMAPVTGLRDANGEHRILWQVTRASCALGNMGLRRLQYPDRYNWFDKVLTAQQKWVANHLAEAIRDDRLDALQGLRHFLVRLDGRDRFLITD